MMENNLRNATLSTNATSSKSEGEKSPVTNQPIVRNTDDDAEPYLESPIGDKLIDVHISTGKAILESVAGVETNATLVLEFPADLRFLLEENESMRANGGWSNSFWSFRCIAAQERQIQRPRWHHPSISWDEDNLSTVAVSLEEEFLSKLEGVYDAFGSFCRMPLVETSDCSVRKFAQNPRQRFGRLLPTSLIRKQWKKKHRIVIDSSQEQVGVDINPAIQSPSHHLLLLLPVLRKKILPRLLYPRPVSKSLEKDELNWGLHELLLWTEYSNPFPKSILNQNWEVPSLAARKRLCRLICG
ncbi:hypothetical protein IV203_017965 [Nitzschia inconspicua]|uniref:Uncharacterized protein n=1 Tax=Nitzschia inconspicua TaxID=303405 RepID=A0A9K3M1B9_9STRA|nr:hypothetical protein IV203_017965 [Nitzschia inconspicua]